MAEDLETIDKWLKEEYGLSYTELNNIINELEQWIDKNEKEDMEICFLHYEIWKKVSNKIKELKEGEKNESL